jgi:hypothetical protein
MNTSAAGLTGYIRVEVYNADGVLLNYADAVPVPLSTTAAGTRLVTTLTVTHPDASRISTYLIGNASAAGQAFGVDGILITPGTELVPWFSGASTGGGYTYEWSDLANDSVSTRTPLVERAPELYVWNPGVTAWDFLQPLITPSSLRLYCDELRVWRLIDPATYAVPGLVAIAGFNTTDAVDTIGRDDAQVFALGVVVRYTWRDASGYTQTAYDSAGDPSKVIVIDYARAYPGPGAAAAILARRDGSGRVQDVAALAQWPVTPGMEASITVPLTPTVRGKVTSVEFSLGDDALMALGSRDLIDIIPGTIDALVGTIDALVGTIDAL